MAITSQRFSRRVREAIADLQRKRGALAGVVEETISGIRAVKGFGAEPIMERRLATSADEVRVEAMRVVTTRARYLPTLNTVPMLELAAVNWLGGYLVIHHELSVGMLVAFNAYLAMLTGPLQSIGAYIVMIQRAVVSGYRLDTIMKRQSAVAEPAHPHPLPPGPGTVRFSDVAFSYPTAGARRHRTAGRALNHFDLDIDGGEVVAMVGATGSGKTTVLSLLARLYDTGSGSVTLEGVDVRDLSLPTCAKRWRSCSRTVSFSTTPSPPTCGWGGPRPRTQELAEAAHLAQADEFIDAATARLPTPWSANGGCRCRAGSANASPWPGPCWPTPAVLVLDDATSAVDAPRELQVVRALAEARTGKTTIIISHRPATIAAADRVVLVDGGRVVAEGSHDQLCLESLPLPPGPRPGGPGKPRPGGAPHELGQPPPGRAGSCHPTVSRVPQAHRDIAPPLPAPHCRGHGRPPGRPRHHVGRPGHRRVHDQQRPRRTISR